MPYQSPFTNAISNLLSEQGAIAARRAQQKADVWAGTIQNIGKSVSGTLADLVQQREEAPIRAHAAVMAKAQEQEIADRAADRKVALADREEAKKRQLSADERTALAAHVDEVGRTAGAILALPPAEQAAAYAQWRQSEIAKGKATPDQMQEAYNPGWVRMQQRRAMTVAEQLASDQRDSDLTLRRSADERAAKTADATAANLAADNTRADAAAAEAARHNKAMENRPVAGAASGDEADAIADAIIRGEQSPETTGLYRVGPQVRAALAKKGYNQAQAITDWKATQKHVATLNGAQQTRMAQAVDNAAHSLDVIDTLADQWNAGKFQALNKVRLAAAKQGVLGPDAQKIAVALDAQISDVTSELGNVYMGGNSPTDHALSLAAKNLSADWSDTTLRAMTKQARTNLQIRQNSMRNVGVAGASANNAYAPPQAAPATGAITKPIPGIPGAEATSTDGGKTWVRSK